jgi:hypothetical protein
MPNPPGSQPRRTCDKRTKRLGAWLSDKRKPEKAKRGMAVSVGVSAIRYISIKMTVRSISATEK